MHTPHGSSHHRSHAQRMTERQMDLAAAGEAKRRRDAGSPPRGGGAAGSVLALVVFLIVVGLIVAQASRAGVL